GIFYVDILDELMDGDIELEKVIDSMADNVEKGVEKINQLMRPYLKILIDELHKLEQANWINGVNIEIILKREFVKTSSFRDVAIPMGYTLIPTLEIKIKKVKWSAFISDLENNFEQNNLNWDDIFSIQKQSRILLQSIIKKSNELEKIQDIAFSHADIGAMREKIQFLKGLKNLEKSDLIKIESIRMCEEKDYIKEPKEDLYEGYYYIKAIVSLTKKAMKMSTQEEENLRIINTNKIIPISKNFSLSIKDREIWVNDKYLLSKPYGAGNNLEFLNYLMENPNKKIARLELPNNIKTEIKNKVFSKILNALGFKGEILKLFFPERGKTKILFNPIISNEELNKRGIRIPVLMKELELAHIKNSPK
ncbi:MAG: hypothetical protein ACD_7C00281G0003, partial [uncultured bacterium]